MEERFAAEDAEIAVAMSLRIFEQSVHVIERNKLPRRLHVYPTPLAAQLTAVDNRNKQKRRKMLAAAQTLLVQLDRTHPFVAEVIGEFPQQPPVRFGHHASREAEKHHGAALPGMV